MCQQLSAAGRIGKRALPAVLAKDAHAMRVGQQIAELIETVRRGDACRLVDVEPAVAV